ncbi:MAG: hypothetical protein QNJ40_06980 [Xanthomonadales bacterium]|nr:hypothetical protein [Xanthomonadales bacterium]
MVLLIKRWIDGLRFPGLLLLGAVLLILNLAIPDPLPWLDEILLAVAAAALASLRKDKPAPPDDGQ